MVLQKKRILLKKALFFADKLVNRSFVKPFCARAFFKLKEICKLYVSYLKIYSHKILLTKYRFSSTMIPVQNKIVRLF